MKEESDEEGPAEQDMSKSSALSGGGASPTTTTTTTTTSVPGTEGVAGVASTGSPTSEKGGGGGGKTGRGGGRGEAAARDKVFVCGVCQRCFGYKHVLQNHERTHTGEKPFECKQCSKRFTRDHHLKTHMRLHTGEKPYHCTHCERCFVQVANLRRHLRVHTGERPYACELCVSRFSDSNQLKAHMLIHKGEKPFECPQCLGRFRRRHHLMHHKCPKQEVNQGKPRRGRRPKTAEDLERDTALHLMPPAHHHQLHHLRRHHPLGGHPCEPCDEPTIVPVEMQRPLKRERKPRETRRIIKVDLPPPMLVLGGREQGCCYALAPATTTSSSPFPLRPPPPPEQTEPEDLSMHANSGDKNGERAEQTPHAHLRPPRILMADDDGDESEAMVEEEEDDDDDEEEEEEDLEPLGLGWRRPSGIRPLHHGQHHINMEERNVDADPDGRGTEVEDDDGGAFSKRMATVAVDASSDDGSDSEGPYEQHRLSVHREHELNAETGNGNSHPRLLSVPVGASRRQPVHQPHHHLLHHPIHLAPHHQLHLPMRYHHQPSHHHHHRQHLGDSLLDAHASAMARATASPSSASSTRIDSMSPNQRNTQ